jgi:hypothetical protein
MSPGMFALISHREPSWAPNRDLAHIRKLKSLLDFANVPQHCPGVINDQDYASNPVIDPPVNERATERLTPVMHIVTLATVVAVVGHVASLINWKVLSGWPSYAVQIYTFIVTAEHGAGLLLFAAALYLSSIAGEPTVKKGLRWFGWLGFALQILALSVQFYETGWGASSSKHIWMLFRVLAVLMNVGLCTVAWRRAPGAVVALAIVTAVRFAHSMDFFEVGDYGVPALRISQDVLYWLLFRALAKDVKCWPQPLVSAGYRNVVQSLSIRLWIAGIGIFLTFIAVAGRSATVGGWLLPLALVGGWVAQWWAVAGALRLTFAGTGAGIRAAVGAACLAWSVIVQFDTVAMVSAFFLRGRESTLSEYRLEKQLLNFQFAGPIATVIGFILLASVVTRVAKQRHHLPIQQLVGACCTVYIISTALTMASPFLLKDVRSVASAIFVMLFIAVAGLVAVIAMRRLFKRAYEAIENEEFHVANLPRAVATVRDA